MGLLNKPLIASQAFVPDTRALLSRRYSRRSFLDRGMRSAPGWAAAGLASLLDACATGSGGIAPTPPPGATVIRSLLFDQVGYDPTVLQNLANRFRSLPRQQGFRVDRDRALPRALRKHPGGRLSKPSPYDVVALDQVWVPEFAAANSC